METRGGIAVAFDGKQVTSKQNRSNPQPGSPCHTLSAGSADCALCVKACSPQGEHGAATVYGLCSNSSNSMKSPNPRSGIYEAATTRTLDGQGGNPSCNQGGMIVVEKDAKAIHESIAGDCVHISDVAYALRSGRKPLMFEEISIRLDLGSPPEETGLEPSGSIHPDIAPTLTASAGGTSRPGGGQGSELDYYMAYALQGNMIGRADRNGPQGSGINVDNCFTLNATDFHAVAFFNHTHTHAAPSQGDKASCQTARQYKKTPVDLIVRRNFVNTGMMNIKESEVANTQLARQSKSTMDYLVSVNANTGFARYSEGIFGTLVRSGGDLGGGSESLLVVPVYIVRRLTPTECERLQGFPDGWTKHGANGGKEIADTPRYQMLGNSVAIPCVRFIMKNIANGGTCSPPGYKNGGGTPSDKKQARSTTALRSKRYRGF